MRQGLSWVLDPLPVETFLDKVWATATHHVRRGRADYFDALVPGSGVQQLVEFYRHEPSAVRLVRDADRCHPDSYRLADGSLDLRRVREKFTEGYTVVLDGVERYGRAVASLAHSIEVELDYPVKVNAYLTPPRSQGLAAHYDEHDVLILQIRGSKTWHLYGDDTAPPHEMCRRQAVVAAGLSPPTDLQLAAGDVLYLPRGRVHAAEASSEPSVHLTFGIHAPTVLSLAVRALYSLSLVDDRVHTRLPPRHLAATDARASAGALLRDIARALEEPDTVAAGLGALEADLVERGRCPPIGPAISAAGIAEHTSVVKHQPLYSRVTATAGEVTLHFAQLTVSAGADHRAAMLFLAKSTEPFRVCDLPGLTAAQRIQLVRALIANGFLRRLTDDRQV